MYCVKTPCVLFHCLYANCLLRRCLQILSECRPLKYLFCSHDLFELQSRFSLPCGILCWIVYWAIFVESLSPSRVGTFLLTSSHFCSIYSRYVCASNHASWGEQNSSYLLMNIRSGWFHSGKLSCSFSFCTLTWRNQLSLNWLNLKKWTYTCNRLVITILLSSLWSCKISMFCYAYS
jgi:hypothetical protein